MKVTIAMPTQDGLLVFDTIGTGKSLFFLDTVPPVAILINNPQQESQQ